MSLNFRQQKIYTDSCDIYRMARQSNGDWAFTLFQSTVPCKLFTTPNNDMIVAGQLQMREKSIWTLNKLHVEVGTDIRAEDMVKITTYPNQPGPFYRVTGDPYMRNSALCNRTEVYLAPSDNPDIV